MSEPDTKKKRPNRRHWTRRLLVQALYQWRLADTELTALLAEFRSDALVLKPQILFRWAHPPLVIPRKVISAREKKGLLRPYLEVRTAADETISFHMYVRQFGWPEDIAGPSKERASP